MLLLDAFKVSLKFHCNDNSSTRFGLMYTKWCWSPGIANKHYSYLCPNSIVEPRVCIIWSHQCTECVISMTRLLCLRWSLNWTRFSFLSWIIIMIKIDTMDDKRMRDSLSGASFRLSSSQTWMHWPVIFKMKCDVKTKWMCETWTFPIRMNEPEAESDGRTPCDVSNTGFNRVTMMDEQQETSYFDKTFSLPFLSLCF